MATAPFQNAVFGVGLGTDLLSPEFYIFSVFGKYSYICNSNTLTYHETIYHEAYYEKSFVIDDAVYACGCFVGGSGAVTVQAHRGR